MRRCIGKGSQREAVTTASGSSVCAACHHQPAPSCRCSPAVIDIEVRWAGEPDVVMQLSGIPGAAVAVRTCQVGHPQQQCKPPTAAAVMALQRRLLPVLLLAMPASCPSVACILPRGCPDSYSTPQPAAQCLSATLARGCTLRAVLSPSEEESIFPLPGGVTGPPACPISACINSPAAPHVCVHRWRACCAWF